MRKSDIMRIVFMGTPDFAAVSLDRLLENNYDVAAVFCQPDKASGRGMDIRFSPVKELAIKYGIDVYQPEKMRDGTALSILKEINPDLLVVVAYGKILPDDILAVPKFGAINVHGSLLPKYRGAAPIQWAVLNGDYKTGVTTMYLAHDMDSGDMIYQKTVDIGEKETSGELFDRLADIGADLLLQTIDDIESGTAPRIEQNHNEATYVTMLDKSICPIDFNNSPRTIIKHICGLLPWPVATMDANGVCLKVFDGDYTSNTTDCTPGTIIRADDSGIEVACADGETILITEVQSPGKKRMKASDYVRGHKLIG